MGKGKVIDGINDGLIVVPRGGVDQNVGVIGLGLGSLITKVVAHGTFPHKGSPGFDSLRPLGVHLQIFRQKTFQLGHHGLGALNGRPHPPIKEFPAFTPLIRFVGGNLVEILGAELVDLVRSYPGVYALRGVITLKGWLEKSQLTGSPAGFFSDGVHPAPPTYQIWARDMAEKVVALGLLPPGKPG
ncbi:MAG: hypothetical protein D6722_16485 [Bacteroidetes bacterium]|nr:MAG: hypothetical protein D6722_16485 [Bacteroidota bacterium]